MASDSQMELRVSRLENDREAIYDLLTGVISTQQEHSERFDKMDGRLDKMDGRLDKMDGRLGKVEHRLGKVEHRLGKVEDLLGGIQTTLTEVVRRLPGPS